VAATNSNSGFSGSQRIRLARRDRAEQGAPPMLGVKLGLFDWMIWLVGRRFEWSTGLDHRAIEIRKVEA
jgi:hypothetical protein